MGPVSRMSPRLVRRALALLAAALLTAASPARAEDLPYPTGRSTQEIEGLQTTLILPGDLTREKPASLVVVLHGYGGTAEGMASSLQAWVAEGYVVAAPKSRGDGWEHGDVAAARAITRHLLTTLPVDPRRLHVIGFSNGGWNLPALAFDDLLRPCTATWVAAGFTGGSVPKWARKDLAAIALAGSLDPNVGPARETVTALRDAVRTVEVREQPGLDHKWPEELMPYLRWWMGVQEGRFTPGDDRSFAWGDDLDAAVASQASKKKGGVLVWAYDEGDEGEEARLVQREVFFDPEVRFLAAQVPAVRLERTKHAEVLEPLAVKAFPALVVLDKKGGVAKRIEGKVRTKDAVKALKGVVPIKAPPKR